MAASCCPVRASSFSLASLPPFDANESQSIVGTQFMLFPTQQSTTQSMAVVRLGQQSAASNALNTETAFETVGIIRLQLWLVVEPSLLAECPRLYNPLPTRLRMGAAKPRKRKGLFERQHVGARSQLSITLPCTIVSDAHSRHEQYGSGFQRGYQLNSLNTKLGS